MLLLQAFRAIYMPNSSQARNYALLKNGIYVKYSNDGLIEEEFTGKTYERVGNGGVPK